jgi:hypothetical protein
MRREITVDPEPPSAPTDPFAERAAPACSAGSKPVADALIATVRAARDAQHNGAPVASTDVAEVVAAGGVTGWLELKPRDVFGFTAALECLHVTSVSPAHLAAAGIADARKQGGLGFAERFGFYVIGSNAPPSPPPSPAASPSASP